MHLVFTCIRECLNSSARIHNTFFFFLFSHLVVLHIYMLQRMDSYFKRNYKDYFEFEEGTIRAKKGELTESEKGILDWLQNNK